MCSATSSSGYIVLQAILRVVCVGFWYSQAVFILVTWPLDYAHCLFSCSSDLMWIDGTDGDTEGTYLLHMGETLSFFYWQPGQPNDACSNQDCLATASSGMQDRPCNERHTPLCSRDLGLRKIPTFTLLCISGCLMPSWVFKKFFPPKFFSTQNFSMNCGWS